MQRAAVLGMPIGHSLSPKLHRFWLQECELKGAYEAIETPPERLEETLTRLQAEGYSGCNLTVPLKEAVLELLDEVTPLAQAIGAVNMVTFRNGKRIGSNSDAYGFTENLKAQVMDMEACLAHCVVLGAGGAARAVVAGLLQAGARRITVLNRSLKRAQTLANELIEAHVGEGAVAVASWDMRDNVLAEASLLVNTTSLGMVNQPPLQISLELLPTGAVVSDIVYNPLETPLLAQARACGHQTVGGIGMLLYQAQPAFEAFFGQRPAVTTRLVELVQS